MNAVIIDAHMHVCDLMAGSPDGKSGVSLTYGRVTRPEGIAQVLPPSFEHSNSPAEMALVYMDWCGVDKAMLMQGGMYGFHNEYVTRAVSVWPDRFMGTAYVNPHSGKKGVEELKRWFDRGLRGLKMEVGPVAAQTPGFSMTGDEEMQVWKACEEMGMLLFLHIRTSEEEIEALKTIVAECAKLKLTICHLAGGARELAQEALQLAKNDNVYTETSGLPVFSRGEDYPYPSAQEALKWAVENIGADKIMWGTDYPSILTYCTYRQTLDVVKNHCSFLTDQQRALILGGTAEKLLATLP